MTVVVDVVESTGLVPDHEAVKRLIQQVLDGEGFSGEVAVAFVDEPSIAGLNERYRNVEGPTDILSFDYGLGEPGHVDGELVVCPQVVLRYADEDRRDPSVQLGWTLIHGALHLAGYDHETDQGEMREREEALLRRLDGSVRQLLLAGEP
jgi:probable rRNA maturation factor